jgi:hypothetical protein
MYQSLEWPDVPAKLEGVLLVGEEQCSNQPLLSLIARGAHVAQEKKPGFIGKYILE